MYFSKSDTARAFKDMFQSCQNGTCTVPAALQSSIVQGNELPAAASRHMSVRIHTVSPSKIVAAAEKECESAASASSADSKPKSLFHKIYKGTRRRILNIPGQTQTIIQKTQGILEKLPSKASIFDRFRNMGFGGKGGGTKSTVPLSEIRAIIDKLSPEELLATYNVKFITELCRYLRYNS